jgi:metal-sulfur cluster biosynthetic enzyme
MVEQAVEQVDGVGRCHVDLVWDPPWSRDRMSDEAKLELGML